MQRRRNVTPADRNAEEQRLRNEEVTRANRELAAYFKGRRTEREARSALKIIKTFIKERERVASNQRPPLPGASRVKPVVTVRSRKSTRVRPRKPKPVEVSPEPDSTS